MTADRLPAAFKNVPDAVRKAAEELRKASNNRFQLMIHG